MLDLSAASRPGRVFVALLLAALGTAASAQTSPPALDALDLLRARTAQPSRQATQALAGAVALEGPVDADTYIVSVGDVFGLSIGGALPVQLAIPVAADGGLVVPDAGRIPAAGRLLRDVTAEVRVLLRRSYRNVVTEVVLAQPAPFLVHVGGAVALPGRHTLPPMARAEDAVSAALGGTSPLDAFEQDAAAGARFTGARPALRSIVLTRAGSETQTVDLRAYYLTGDPAFNPILRAGDRLTVPIFDEGRAVAVEGAAPFAGPYDLRPGDTAADLLRLAAGPAGVAALGPIQLARLGPDGTTRILPLAAAAVADPAASVVLQARDRIVVAPFERLRGAVEISGEVAFPGGYPIESGKATLADLLELAGGLTPEALPRAIYVEREQQDDQDTAGASDTPGLAVSPLREEAERAEAAATAAGRSDLSYSGRQFLAYEREQAPRLVMDLSNGLGPAAGLRLRDGDRVVVPADPGGIRVAGQVVRPGLLPFAPGADASYYVAQAGGLAGGAEAVYVRDAASGALRPAQDAAIFPGDLVFVDRTPVGDTPAQQQLLIQQEQLDLQEQREVVERRYRLVQTVISLVVPAITTYLIVTNTN